MKAMCLERIGEPLRLRSLPVPTPGAHQIRLKVEACAVCRTDLHVVDGELPPVPLPVIPGHEAVGKVDALGEGVSLLRCGDRVGVPWLGHTCGQCLYCLDGQENLCEEARFTGYQLQGGFAEYLVADERFCFPIPERLSPLEAAPFLCAGLIGYRALQMAGKAKRLGFFGFGAAAHLLAQVAVAEGREVYAFTREGDAAAQAFALRLGAVWAGASSRESPVPLDAALLFAPVGALVPAGLRAVRKGGIVVCAGIHMSDIPSFPYRILWEERILRSVANLTRQDGLEFLPLAARLGLKSDVVPYRLEDAWQALTDLREGRLQGAAVLEL